MVEWQTETRLYIIKRRSGLNVSFGVLLRILLNYFRSQGKSKRINLNSPLTRIPKLPLCLYQKGCPESELVILCTNIWRRKNCSCSEKAG